MRNKNRSDNHSLHVLGAASALALAATLAPPSSAQAYTYNVLYNFCSQSNCTDGGEPGARLLMDSAGNLYGTTSGAGPACGVSAECGTIFELVNAGGTYTEQTIYNFCSKPDCADGGESLAHLIMDVKGSLYGTTRALGNGAGTIFKLNPNGSKKKWTLTTLYDFCQLASCTDGNEPDAGLTYAGAESGALYDGRSPLYGTTTFGGNGDAGVAFQWTPGSHVSHGPGRRSPAGSPFGPKYSVIYNFCSQSNCSDGAFANELLADASGNVYGTTSQGGNNTNSGVAFELVPNGTGFTENVLYTFCQLASCADGSAPDGPVTLNGNGLLGTVGYGGQCDSGLLYSLTSSNGTWRESATSSFCGTSGIYPNGRVLLNGDLFGEAFAGGNTTSSGTLWTQSGEILQVLYTFCSQANCSDGLGPIGGLVADSSGNLFGVTGYGGTGSFDGEVGQGVVFELSP